MQRNIEFVEERLVSLLRVTEHLLEGDHFNIAIGVLVKIEKSITVRHLLEIPLRHDSSEGWCEVGDNERIEGRTVTNVDRLPPCSSRLPVLQRVNILEDLRNRVLFCVTDLVVVANRTLKFDEHHGPDLIQGVAESHRPMKDRQIWTIFALL